MHPRSSRLHSCSTHSDIDVSAHALPDLSCTPPDKQHTRHTSDALVDGCVLRSAPVQVQGPFPEPCTSCCGVAAGHRSTIQQNSTRQGAAKRQSPQRTSQGRAFTVHEQGWPDHGMAKWHSRLCPVGQRTGKAHCHVGTQHMTQQPVCCQQHLLAGRGVCLAT